jgi:hypothetical protein
MGKTKTAKRMRAFFLSFKKIGKRINRISEAMTKGAWGTQSYKTPEIMFKKEPGFP